MTANQINLAKLREERRHNRVSERHEHQDVLSRSITAQAADRNATTNWWSAQEQGRHNLETERVSSFSANALADYQNVQGQALLRQASVAERNADTNYRNATTSERLATVSEKDLANKYRSSVAAESQAATASRNAATRESELAASILMNNKQVALGYSQLAEARRHSQATEAETKRANLISEGISRQRNSIQSAYNKDMAEIGRRNAGSSRIQALASGKQADVASRNATTNERHLNLDKLKVANDTVSSLARSFVLLH